MWTLAGSRSGSISLPPNKRPTLLLLPHLLSSLVPSACSFKDSRLQQEPLWQVFKPGGWLHRRRCPILDRERRKLMDVQLSRPNITGDESDGTCPNCRSAALRQILGANSWSGWSRTASAQTELPAGEWELNAFWFQSRQMASLPGQTRLKHLIWNDCGFPKPLCSFLFCFPEGFFF